MTKEQIEIFEALNERVHVSRLTRTAAFLAGLAAKPDLKAYKLNSTKEQWLYSLLHRYRKSIPDVHEKHCEQCRIKEESKPKAVQLSLWF